MYICVGIIYAICSDCPRLFAARPRQPHPRRRDRTCGRSFLRRHITSFPLQRTRKIGISSQFPYVHARVQVVSNTHAHAHARDGYLHVYNMYTIYIHPFRLQVVFIDWDTTAGVVCAYNVHLILYYRIVQRTFLRQISTGFPRARSPNGDCTRRSDTDNIRAKIVARADDDARIRSYAFVTNKILPLFVYIYIYICICVSVLLYVYIVFHWWSARTKYIYIYVYLYTWYFSMPT